MLAHLKHILCHLFAISDLVNVDEVQFAFRYALTVWYIDREERREYAHRVRTKNRESDGLHREGILDKE